jgi:ATP-binding cassette subfamily B protein
MTLENWDLRIRVVGSLGFLIGAKVLTVQVPLLFKEAVDVLSVPSTDQLVAVPVAAVLGCES